MNKLVLRSIYLPKSVDDWVRRRAIENMTTPEKFIARIVDAYMRDVKEADKYKDMHPDAVALRKWLRRGGTLKSWHEKNKREVGPTRNHNSTG